MKTDFKHHQETQALINQFGYQCIDALKSIMDQTNEVGEINLVKIFFHELVCLFTSTYITTISGKINHNKSQLPFVNSAFINDPYHYEIIDKTKNKTSLIYHLFRINFWSKKTLWIGPTLRREQKRILFKKAMTHQIRPIESQKISIDKTKVESFYKTISQLSTELKLPLTKSHFDSISLYFNQFLAQENQYKKGILFNGTNTKIQSRLAAASFLQNKQKVISFGHGDASISLFEEPVFEYGEQWFSSSFIDFGRISKGIEDKNLKIIKRTSSRVKSLYDKKIKAKTRGKYLYVPTSMSDYFNYAPFRNFYDQFYSDWQQALIEGLKISGIDFKVALHPKTKTNYDKISKNTIEHQSLEWCFENYEILIFDYVSTALTEALATQNKVIFFDLGNRKISSSAIDRIKQDAQYKKIEFDQDITNQITSTVKQSKKRDFTFINAYSINGQEINKIINQII